MIAAHQDNFIEALDFGVLGPPSASYIVERRSTRIPFLAPVYAADGGGGLDDALCPGR